MAKQTASTPQGKPATGSRSVRARAASAGGDTIARRASRTSITAYIEQSWAELKKVTWPTRQETMNLTVAVIVMTVAVALFLGVVDAGLDKLVQVLIG